MGKMLHGVTVRGNLCRAPPPNVSTNPKPLHAKGIGPSVIKGSIKSKWDIKREKENSLVVAELL